MWAATRTPIPSVTNGSDRPITNVKVRFGLGYVASTAVINEIARLPGAAGTLSQKSSFWSLTWERTTPTTSARAGSASSKALGALTGCVDEQQEPDSVLLAARSGGVRIGWRKRIVHRRRISISDRACTLLRRFRRLSDLLGTLTI